MPETTLRCTSAGQLVANEGAHLLAEPFLGPAELHRRSPSCRCRRSLSTRQGRRQGRGRPFISRCRSRASSTGSSAMPGRTGRRVRSLASAAVPVRQSSAQVGIRRLAERSHRCRQRRRCEPGGVLRGRRSRLPARPRPRRRSSGISALRSASQSIAMSRRVNAERHAGGGRQALHGQHGPAKHLLHLAGGHQRFELRRPAPGEHRAGIAESEGPHGRRAPGRRRCKSDHRPKRRERASISPAMRPPGR